MEEHLQLVPVQKTKAFIADAVDEGMFVRKPIPQGEARFVIGLWTLTCPHGHMEAARTVV